MNYSSSHSFVLSVVAFDCQQRMSDTPLIVVVKVTQPCQTGWTGTYVRDRTVENESVFFGRIRMPTERKAFFANLAGKSNFKILKC